MIYNQIFCVTETVTAVEKRVSAGSKEMRLLLLHLGLIIQVKSIYKMSTQLFS